MYDDTDNDLINIDELCQRLLMVKHSLPSLKNK